MSEFTQDWSMLEKFKTLFQKSCKSAYREMRLSTVFSQNYEQLWVYLDFVDFQQYNVIYSLNLQSIYNFLFSS
jgi:hypothetical protein